jgi:hypothetical protein
VDVNMSTQCKDSLSWFGRLNPNCSYIGTRKESAGMRKFFMAFCVFVAFFQLALAGRYYDARTGRFLQIDPKAEKLTGWSPYNYALCNPLTYVDRDGKEPNRAQATSWNQARQRIEAFFDTKNVNLQGLRYVSGDATGKQVGPFGGDKGARYIYTQKMGWIDLGHFFQTAAGAQTEIGEGVWKWVATTVGRDYAEGKLWEKTEAVENAQKGETQWSYEDAPSNKAGLDFYLDYFTGDSELLKSLDRYFEDTGAVDPSKAPNWGSMQAAPEKERRFEQNKSFEPQLTPELEKTK